MSQFNYADYQNVIAQAQSSDGNKVGFFKLKDDGDEALVRFNCSSVEDLQFASVHTLQADGKWMRISCLNPLGNYSESCALCNAVKAGDKRISKAGKKVYLQMLCAYKDKTTGQFSEAIPVIWERPAAFSRDIANKLKDFGDLRNTILKVTRNGVAGDMKTTYSIDFVPIYNKPELVPADFSAFTNFNIAKHSYWEKTAEDIATFLSTGKFPEIVKSTNNAQTANVAPVYGNAAQYAAPQYAGTIATNPQVGEQVIAGGNQPLTTPMAQNQPQPAPVTPVYTAPAQATQPNPGFVQPAPQMPVPNQESVNRIPAAGQVGNAAIPDNRPTRNFGGFNF